MSKPAATAEERSVRQMARRLALLYYYFARTLSEELGEEEGMRLVEKATREYGLHVGRAVRERLEEQGLELTPENYGKAADLPPVGWEFHTTQSADGEIHTACTYCPVAVTWQELGADKIGRMYCHMDQARYEGFNPEYELVHTQTVLDGDERCAWVIRKRQE
jgi:predicted ArsR family transcriptional regulator